MFRKRSTIIKWLERFGYGAEGLRNIAAQTRPRDHKTFLMLNSAEHEILNAHKNKILRNSAIIMLR